MLRYDGAIISYHQVGRTAVDVAISIDPTLKSAVVVKLVKALVVDVNGDRATASVAAHAVGGFGANYSTVPPFVYYSTLRIIMVK